MLGPADTVQPASTEHDGPKRHLSPNCYVVKVRSNITSTPHSIDCRHLSDEALAELGRSVAVWTNHVTVVDRVWTYSRTRGLPPLAVVFENAPKHLLPTPLPIDVPFEPTPLDESHPSLRHLIRLGDASDSIESTSATVASPLQRALIRAGIPTLSAALAIGQVISIWDGFRWNSPWHLVSVSVIGIAVVLLVLSLLRRAQWLIVPGALIQRSPGAWWTGVALCRFTPPDSVLILCPESPGWRAELWVSGKQAARRLITTLEAMALLAAWQSPLRTPTLDEMSDLH